MDFRSLHLRNKDCQRNEFQILSEEITIKNTVNISKDIYIDIWKKSNSWISIFLQTIFFYHSLIYTEATTPVACNNWSRHAYFDEKLAMSQILWGFFVVFFLLLKLIKIFVWKFIHSLFDGNIVSILWRLSNCRWCKFCHIQEDYVHHLIFYHSLWLKLYFYFLKSSFWK